MIKFITTIIIVVIVVFVFSIFKLDDDKSSAGYIPGDAFYFLDKSFEWLQLNFFTLTEDKKIKLEIKFLNERLSELESLKEKKELTEKKAKKLMNDYNKLTDRVEADIEKAKKAKKDIDVFLEKIKSLTEKHQNVIEKISEETPEKTLNFINNISDWGKDSYNKLKTITK